MHRIRVPAALALSAALLGLSSSEARPENGNHASFEARVEPERVAPGETGTLVLVGKILPKVHVYADSRFKVVAAKAPGVVYGDPETTKSQDWTSPYLADEPPEKVWFDKVEVRIPFTLDATAADPAKVGASVKWSSCDEDQCFAPESQSVEVVVRRPEGAAAPAPAAAAAVPVAMPAPGPGAPAGAAPPARPTLVLHGPDDANPAVHKIDDKVASVEIKAHRGEVTVSLAPKNGYHLYIGDKPANDVVVEGRSGQNLVWKKAAFPLLDSTEVHEPATVRLRYEPSGVLPASGTIFVRWSGCRKETGCERPVPVEVDLKIVDPSAATPPVAPPPPVEPKSLAGGSIAGGVSSASTTGSESGLLFPVIGGQEKTWIQSLWESIGLLFLGPIFLVGLGLAFTPCVLPIIPITVSIIGGGRADLPKSRLTVLLVSYVLGLSTAFGSLGLVAALGGGSISAAFESPVVVWVIVGIFVLLAMGMFGIYELQPPAWVQRIQGQRKGGSIPAAFLFGALAAVIASPCTGPVIVAMLLFTAQGGNDVLGFVMFFTLGLGMGAVFFAAGALNFVMRPGPWMVWVRYVFGVLLVGVALYYLGNGRMVSPVALLLLGFGVAGLVALGIAHHLVKKEGEAVAPARRRGLQAAALVAVTAVVVFFLTRPAEAAKFDESVQKEPWITLRDRAHLKAEVESAKGHPVVVDTTADWCHFCHAWEALIASDADLRRGFSRMKRLQIDVTDDQRDDLRSGIGAQTAQPWFVFLDAEGRVIRRLDLGGNPDKDAMMKVLRELGVVVE